MAVNQNAEESLVGYLESVLKCQIAPIDLLTLRDLVRAAPKKLKIFDFIEENYPDSKFSDFLEKYPNLFTLHPDRTVTSAGPNYCTLPHSNPTNVPEQMCDEVDSARNREEYQSDDSGSESDDTENHNLLNSALQSSKKSEDKVRIIDSDSTSCSESSDEYFSSEMVQTSDSLHSSLSSDSSSEDK